MSTADLFADERVGQREEMGSRAYVLRGFALPYMDELLIAIADLEAASHFRQMVTPGGFTMSVALTNCGRFGWPSGRHGYRSEELRVGNECVRKYRFRWWPV